jgi:hypothetical protein
MASVLRRLDCDGVVEFAFDLFERLVLKLCHYSLVDNFV